MSYRLESSYAKLRRAETHHEVLQRRVVAFVKRNPLAVRSEHNLEGPEQLLRFRYFVKSVRQPPPGWAVILGDAVQNLRAALDHAVWVIVVKENGTEFAQAHAPQIDFPVVDRAALFPLQRLRKIRLP